ncbi:response regulator [Sporosarcina thermotolerans]|uniref:Response regulator n=1 Tax=Sporosarcina thermotolerans TaxID=633404 RepID=A0AAW9ACJ9_9BACL|nr:response regulator [Sporosarcina thermotolerans]MDW0118313.1 response regulator [Sporosarcina thermotolerans]WHT48618.1 response regulator [Sporosarcina thermotolerans]
MRYFIIDDDKVSRSMLKSIIVEQRLGIVVGESDGSLKTLEQVHTLSPNLVLIDLLMPEMDGIEMIRQLKAQGFRGQFVMLSQVVNKEMVGEAYQAGVEFFIHKPINRIEVENVLRQTIEKIQLMQSLVTIRDTLSYIGSPSPQKVGRSLKEVVLSILQDMGIAGENGSADMLNIMEVLTEQRSDAAIPPLKQLYEMVARKMGVAESELPKEVKAMEQRIRRSITVAIDHLASLGAVDYTIHEFEYYAPRFFDFQEISTRMKQIQNEETPNRPVKVQVKKFLLMLYKETIEQQNNFL